MTKNSGGDDKNEGGEGGYNLRKRKAPETSKDEKKDEDYEEKPKRQGTPKKKETPKKKAKTSAGSDDEAGGEAVEGLQVGEEVPKFDDAVSHDGSKVSMAEILGNGRAVVFFFDKSEAPTSVTEINAFKDSHDDFKKNTTSIIGVSADSVETLKDFATKNSTPFPLVSDTELKIIKAFKVEGRGKKAKRATFLVEKDGKITKVWHTIRALTHAKSVLKEVEPPKEPKSPATPKKKGGATKSPGTPKDTGKEGSASALAPPTITTTKSPGTPKDTGNAPPAISTTKSPGTPKKDVAKSPVAKSPVAVKDSKSPATPTKGTGKSPGTPKK